MRKIERALNLNPEQCAFWNSFLARCAETVTEADTTRLVQTSRLSPKVTELLTTPDSTDPSLSRLRSSFLAYWNRAFTSKSTTSVKTRLSDSRSSVTLHKNVTISNTCSIPFAASIEELAADLKVRPLVSGDNIDDSDLGSDSLDSEDSEAESSDNDSSRSSTQNLDCFQNQVCPSASSHVAFVLLGERDFYHSSRHIPEGCFLRELDNAEFDKNKSRLLLARRQAELNFLRGALHWHSIVITPEEWGFWSFDDDLYSDLAGEDGGIEEFGSNVLFRIAKEREEIDKKNRETIFKKLAKIG